MVTVFAYIVLLVVYFAVHCGVTALLQWALLAAFHLSVPFWPLFAILFLLGMVVRSARS